MFRRHSLARCPSSGARRRRAHGIRINTICPGRRRDTFYVGAGILQNLPLEIACHIHVAQKASRHEIGGEAPQYEA